MADREGLLPQRLAAVEVQMAEVDRRARDLAAGMASHPTDFVAASGPIRSPGGESGIPLSQTMPRASGPGPFGSPEALAEGADCGLASTDVKESGVSPT